MATGLKTIEYWFPHGTTANDNSDTNLTQITIYIPESSPTFKNVTLDLSCHDRNTTLSNSDRMQLSLQLGSAGYSAVNNTNTLTNGGEQWWFQTSADFTSYFTSNWSGTSMTCDARWLGNLSVFSPLTPSFNNICARLVITYEYDDTSTTQVKTVRIPLDMPVTTLATSKPGSATATIPALDTELPEASKTYRQITIVVQGNDHAGSSDVTINHQIDSLTQFSSDSIEHGSNCSEYVRLASIAPSFTTNATHSWYVWAGVSNVGCHMQAWMVVTYEFDASTTTSVFIHTMIPLDFGGGTYIFGSTSSDYTRGKAELWIEEDTTITTKQLAAYIFWTTDNRIQYPYFRLGTGSFIQYTSTATVLAGGMAAMVRNDSAYTLARGKNSFVVDIYHSTLNTNAHWSQSGFLMVNYTCTVPSAGISACNKTIEWYRYWGQSYPQTIHQISSSAAITIPETNYHLQNVGMHTVWLPSSGVVATQPEVSIERTTGEGGLFWEDGWSHLPGDEGETGIYNYVSNLNHLFRRWPSDEQDTRLDIETARRFRIVTMTNPGLGQINIFFTYHSITFPVTSTISGSGGGTVYVTLFRDANNEACVGTSRTGNGDVTFNWYDDTEDIYLAAYEDDTHTGRSATGAA